MKCKKRLFDVGLYLEAIKQLRMIGIMSSILMLIAAVSTPISTLLSLQKEQTITGIEYASTNPMMVLSFMALAPLLTLSIFNFMNKRNASDFYHAIPISRLGLFFSMFAAVVTWFTLALVISNGAALILWQVMSSYYSINLTGALIAIFNIWAGSVMVAGAVAVAMCITGTTFTNIVVSLLIIFFPRLVTTVFMTLLNSALWITQGLPFIPLVDNKYNVVTNLFLAIFSFFDFQPTFTYIWGGVYTLILGLLYIGLAAVLFYWRKSESAEHAAPNLVLQTIYRLCCAMVFCLIPCAMIVELLLNPRFSVTNDYYVGIVVFYLVAMVIYFSYELITTRKWKRVAQSIPAIGILAIMNVAFIGSIVGVYNMTLNDVPSADQIVAVRRISSNSGFRLFGMEEKNYFQLQEENIRLTDKEVTEMVAEQLAKTVNSIKELGSPDNYDYFPNEKEERDVAVSFAIETKGRTIYRRILMKPQQHNILAKKIAENPEYRKLYTQLPKVGENGTKVTIGNLTEKQAEAVYNSIIAEVSNVDLDKWYAHLSQYSGWFGYSPDMPGLPYVIVVTNYGTGTATFRFQLSPLLPESLSLYIEKVNQDTTITTILNAMKQYGNWTEYDNLMMHFYNKTADNEQGILAYFSKDGAGNISNPADTLSVLAEALDDHRTTKVDASKPFVFIQWTSMTGDVKGFQLSEHSCYLPYPESVPLPAELIELEEEYFEQD